LGTLHQNPWNAQIALSDNAIGKTRTFDWFSWIIQGRNFSWRLWAFGSSLHRSHRLKYGKSVQNCEQRQSTIL
jgi:hypothetical protein